MDINQSSLSRSKLNKPGVARSSSENKAIAEAHNAKESPPSPSVSNTKQPELIEGQLIKGQIVDLRYNEVKIQLDPGNQVVTAQLSGDVPLAIGQEAQFIVTEDGSDRLVLKYVPESTSHSDATIQKALIASGLPMNDRNRAIVEELLKHMMPVDKQTLQNLVRVSHSSREASPLTLVLMRKNNIPMTPANIKQFEAYQNGTGRLINDIRSITKGLSELLLVENPSIQSISPGVRNDQTGESGQTISQSAIPISVQNLTTTSSGTDSNKLTQALQINNSMLDILLGNHKLPAPITDATTGEITSLITQQAQESLSREETQPTLLKQLNQSNNDLAPLADLLDVGTQSSLAELLRSEPSLSQLADQVIEGTISTKELFNTLKSNLPQLEESGVLKLLTSPEYRTLLESAFHDKWTITPEKLSNKAALHELYESLRDDMEQLTALSKLEIPIKEDTRLQGPVKNLQENLRFMQDLNQMYTYLQLPVQFKNQDVHSELYVLTRKKALQNKEDLSVLLHLDMTNLGSMNIHIHMNHNNISAKFYMEDADAKNLVSQYMPSLTEALAKKGYSLHSEVNQAYEKIDFSNDFIEDTVTEGDVKRYTFDIRT